MKKSFYLIQGVLMILRNAEMTVAMNILNIMITVTVFKGLMINTTNFNPISNKK